MAIIGSPVKFVYLQTGVRPANPDESTVYFAPESSSIFVGDVAVIDGQLLQNEIADLQDAVSDLEANQMSIDITGEGNVVANAEFNQDTKTLVLTKDEFKESELTWDVINDEI